MDRTENDPTIPWTVLVIVNRGWEPVPSGIPEAFIGALTLAVESLESLILDLGPERSETTRTRIIGGQAGINGALGCGEAARARFIVQASTRGQAWDLAWSTSQAALEKALAGAGVEQQSPLTDWDLDSITVFPLGSELAEHNCALDLGLRDEG